MLLDTALIARPIIHYACHFLVPAVIAWVLWPRMWLKAWGIMIFTMLVDLDHLLATPLFDPDRCSIGTHPLHSPIAIGLYAVLMISNNAYVRIIGVGLVFHMFTDWQDCLWASYS